VQSSKHSAIEQCFNVGSGFIVAMLYWQSMVSWQVEGQEMTWLLNLSITTQFTVISFLRGYFWRRAGNWFALRDKA